MNIKNQIARVIQRNLDIFDSKQNNYKNQDEFIRDVTDGVIYAKPLSTPHTTIKTMSEILDPINPC